MKSRCTLLWVFCPAPDSGVGWQIISTFLQPMPTTLGRRRIWAAILRNTTKLCWISISTHLRKWRRLMLYSVLRCRMSMISSYHLEWLLERSVVNRSFWATQFSATVLCKHDLKYFENIDLFDYVFYGYGIKMNSSFINLLTKFNLLIMKNCMSTASLNRNVILCYYAWIFTVLFLYYPATIKQKNYTSVMHITLKIYLKSWKQNKLKPHFMVLYGYSFFNHLKTIL